MAEQSKNEENLERDDIRPANLPVSTPRSMRPLAEELPERDEVERAYKNAMLADSTQQEAKEKVKAVDASPDAPDTPSGGALKAVAGISHDTKRGDAYLREKTARRWGYVPVGGE